MAMILSISWKNIWRSKSRSLIIMTAITLGIYGGLFLVAFMVGMTDQRTASAIKTETAHVVIHKKAYKVNTDFTNYITNVSNIEAALKNNERIAGYSKRIIVHSLASTAETGTGVKIIGIDPKTEPLVSNINTKITEGQYFGEIRGKPVVIGKKLADKLNVGIRSKIVLQLQDTSGMFFPVAFRVAGIYKTSNTTFDELNVFVRNTDIRPLTGLNERSYHEVAILLKSNTDVFTFDNELKEKLPNYLVENWKEANLMLGYTADVMDQYMVIIMAIILLALFFGIVNTMLMAIMERTKEIGMLMAIGMNKTKVFLMIMFETTLLSSTGAIIGIILGMLTTLYFGTHGLNLSLWSKGLESIGYDPVVYLKLAPAYLLSVVFMVVVTSFLASVYPAIKALKLNPVEAIRSDI